MNKSLWHKTLKMIFKKLLVEPQTIGIRIKHRVRIGIEYFWRSSRKEKKNPKLGIIEQNVEDSRVKFAYSLCHNNQNLPT